ncbi:MAG: aminotransferase class IV [Balneolales bacterium]
MTDSHYAIQDGEILPSDEAVIPAVSSAASYGDGCFETLRAYSGRLPALGRHLNRLKRSMTYLGMAIPDGFTPEYFTEEADRLLERNALKETDARVRLQIWRVGPLGYGSGDDDPVSFLLTATPLAGPGGAVSLFVATRRRIPSEALGSGFKLSNGLNYILARREAVKNGFNDALMLDCRNRISETTIANIFWKSGNDVFTPSVGCDLLPGITREIQLEWLQGQNNLSVHTGEFTLEDLMKAGTAWLTNSVQEVMPVSFVNETPFNEDDPFLEKLKQEYRKRIRHEP